MPRRDLRVVDPQIAAELMQIEPAVKRRILNYATRRMHMLAQAGYAISTDEASILLADAIADTLTGSVMWDRRYPLCYHLCGVVRSRTSNQLKRAKQRAHVSLDSVGEDNDLVIVQSISGGRAPARPDDLLESARIVRSFHYAIRKCAMRDMSLMALLDAYAAGFVKRRDVMKLTGLSRAEFVNARRRLDRMLSGIPVDLRSAALAIARDSPPSWIEVDSGYL